MPETKRPLKVFLSYASQDKPLVQELSRRLVGEDWIDVWQDERSLLPGQDWRIKILDAVETSDIVIICLSNNSVNKEGYIQKELRYAQEIALEKPEDTIFLIPLRLEECKVPRGLRFYQWVDYFGEKKDGSYKALITSLRLRHEQRLILEEAERLQQEKLENKTVEKAAHEKTKNKEDNLIADRKEDKAGTIKPVKSVQIAYWLAGFVVLILGIVFLSSLIYNPPMNPVPTPENTQVKVTFTSTHSEMVEPSFTPTQNLTSTPADTLTPTPLPIEITDAKGVSMVLVPAGEFTMGSEGFDPNERPVHQVSLDSFYIDKYEVTNSLYAKCVMDAGACNTPAIADKYGDSKYEDHPVVYVSWNMAEAYCGWRGASLPTEAEWEKAARGYDGRKYPWVGDLIDRTYANFSETLIGNTTFVGRYPKGRSPYFAYDMAGNVWEWVADRYSETYYETYPADQWPANPPGPDFGDERVIRGGGWGNDKFDVRSALRYKNIPTYTTYDIGFRCAKSVTAETPIPTVQSETPNASKTPADGYEIIIMPTVAYRGGTVTVEISTQPATRCALGFILPSGQLSQASGTGPDTADENGVCSWAWKVANNVTPGRGSIFVDAAGMKESYPIEIR